jgi:hypothetical protein
MLHMSAVRPACSAHLIHSSVLALHRRWGRSSLPPQQVQQHKQCQRHVFKLNSCVFVCCRNAVEHFGHRMERWFSPSNTTSMDGSWSRGSTAPGSTMAQLAALSSAALPEDAAAEEQAQCEAAAPAAATTATAAANPFAPAGSQLSTPAAAVGAAAVPVAGRAPSMVLHLPVSTAAASGLGPTAGSSTGPILSPAGSPRMLPGSWQSTGGGSHHSSAAAAWQAAQGGVGGIAAAAGSQPGTPGAVHVSLEHLPSLPSDPGMLRQHSGVEGTGFDQSSQASAQQQQRQHPWQTQAASGAW